jgi:putative DNA primase/helicase
MMHLAPLTIATIAERAASPRLPPLHAHDVPFLCLRQLPGGAMLDDGAKHGEGRFERWVDPQGYEARQGETSTLPPGERFRVQHRAGWKRWIKETDDRWGWRYFLTAEGMAEALAGLNGRDAKKVLVERGFMLPGNDGKTARVIAPPGHKRVRAYEVLAAVLGSDAGDQ